MNKINIDEARGFLEKNKIFFEVFQFIFLGLLGFIVSINSCSISSEEVKLHRNEKTPHILVKSNMQDPDTIGNFNTQEILIINDGEGPAKNFKYKINSFYKIRLSCGRCTQERYFNLPIDYYFKKDSISAEIKNILVHNSIKNNHSEYLRFYNQCKSNWGAFKTGYNPQLLILINISYEDIADNLITEYYLIENEYTYYSNSIEPIIYGRTISKEKYENIIKDCKLPINKPMYVSGVNYDYVQKIYSSKGDSIIYTRDFILNY